MGHSVACVASRHLVNVRVAQLMLSFIMVMCTASAKECSINGLQNSLTVQSGHIRSQIMAAENLVNSMHDIIMSYLMTDFTSNFVYNGRPYAPFNTDVDRARDDYIRTYLNDEQVNLDCVYNKTVEIDAISEGEVPWSTFQEANCTSPRSSMLTTLCPLKYPQCPPTGPLLDAPMSLREWNVLSNGTFCPKYCLEPGAFNNSLTNVIVQATRPLDLIALPTMAANKELLKAAYFEDPAGNGCYYGDIHLDLQAQVGWEMCWTYFMTTTPPIWRSKRLLYTPSYYDQGFTNQMMVSALRPILYGGEYFGLVGADMLLAQISDGLSLYRPTNATRALVTDGSTVVLATQDTWNFLFCPSESCTSDGVFDLSVVTTTDMLTASADIAALPALMNAPDVLQIATIFGVDSYVMTLPIPDVNANWRITALTPRTDIDNAAVWNIRAVDIAVPLIDRTQNESVVVELKLSNVGTESAPWKVSDLPPYLSIMPSRGRLQPGQFVVLKMLFVPKIQSNSLVLSLDMQVHGRNTDSGVCFPTLFVKVPIEYLPIFEQYSPPQALLIVVIIMFVLFTGALMLSAALIWKHRTDPMVKAASPVLLMITSFGAVIMACGALVLAILPTNDMICQSRWFLLSLGYALTLAPQICKAYRIQKIFTGKVELKQTFDIPIEPYTYI